MEKTVRVWIGDKYIDLYYTFIELLDDAEVYEYVENDIFSRIEIEVLQ